MAFKQEEKAKAVGKFPITTQIKKLPERIKGIFIKGGKAPEPEKKEGVKEESKEEKVKEEKPEEKKEETESKEEKI